MPSTPGVLPFPRPALLRRAKARLRDKPPAPVPQVQELITLAPILWRCDPDSVPVVVTYMRNLIGEPPEGGVEVDTTRRDQAANGHHRTPALPRRARPAPRRLPHSMLLLTLGLDPKWLPAARVARAVA